MLLFLAGYMGVWMAAAAAPLPMILASSALIPRPGLSLGAAAAVATLWQLTPAKQWCLNRCHNRPSLAAFGAAANRDVWVFGLTQGIACVGARWALMGISMLMMSTPAGHLVGMAAVAVFTFAERLERPAPLEGLSVARPI